MVNKPLIRPYFLGGVALGGVARISMNFLGLKITLGAPCRNHNMPGPSEGCSAGKVPPNVSELHKTRISH